MGAGEKFTCDAAIDSPRVKVAAWPCAIKRTWAPLKGENKAITMHHETELN